VIQSETKSYPSPSEQDVRSIQIVCAALASGVILFVFVVLAAYFVIPAGELPRDVQFYWLLTSVQLVMSGSLLVLSSAVFNRLLDRIRDAPDQAFSLLRSALIVRLAMLEAGALYGIVVCLLAVLDGTMKEHPVFWINLAGAVGMLLFLSWSFPTKERQSEWIESRILD